MFHGSNTQSNNKGRRAITGSSKEVDLTQVFNAQRFRTGGPEGANSGGKSFNFAREALVQTESTLLHAKPRRSSSGRGAKYQLHLQHPHPTGAGCVCVRTTIRKWKRQQPSFPPTLASPPTLHGTPGNRRIDIDGTPLASLHPTRIFARSAPKGSMIKPHHDMTPCPYPSPLGAKSHRTQGGGACSGGGGGPPCVACSHPLVTMDGEDEVDDGEGAATTSGLIIAAAVSPLPPPPPPPLPLPAVSVPSPPRPPSGGARWFEASPSRLTSCSRPCSSPAFASSPPSAASQGGPRYR